MASVAPYLRHIKLYGPEGVLESLPEERFRGDEIVQIVRECIREGMRLSPTQRDSAIRGMLRSDMDVGAIASVLDVSRRTVTSVQKSLSEGHTLG